jgi:hypothetical protein
MSEISRNRIGIAVELLQRCLAASRGVAHNSLSASFHRGVIWSETTQLGLEAHASAAKTERRPFGCFGRSLALCSVGEIKSWPHAEVPSKRGRPAGEGSFAVAPQSRRLFTEDRLSVHGRRSPRHHASRVTRRRLTHYNGPPQFPLARQHAGPRGHRPRAPNLSSVESFGRRLKCHTEISRGIRFPPRFAQRRTERVAEGFRLRVGIGAG